MKTIRSDSASLVDEFVAWVDSLCGVRLVVIEGYPGSGKSFLLQRLPSRWACIEVDAIIGKGHDESIGWTELARLRGVEALVRTAIETHPLVIVEGPAAWPVLADLMRELGSAAVRVYVQHWPISGGVPHWTDGDNRQLWVDMANHEYWRDIMRHHATKPEHAADLILQRVSHPPTPESVYLELRADMRPGKRRPTRGPP